jgi:hypothetical protein
VCVFHGDLLSDAMLFGKYQPFFKPIYIPGTKLKIYGPITFEEDTFENKNLNKFKGFFTADAMERGKSFSRMLPKYRRNFEILDSIGYQIELKKYFQKHDAGILELQGRFRVNWISYGADWQERFGWISMSLVNYKNSYRIKRLDYNVEI